MTAAPFQRAYEHARYISLVANPIRSLLGQPVTRDVSVAVSADCRDRQLFLSELDCLSRPSKQAASVPCYEKPDAG